MASNCVFDENGWIFTGDHWYNTITNDRTTSSPYETSDNEEDITSPDDNSIPDSDTTASELDTVITQGPDNITQEFDTVTRNSDNAIQNSGANIRSSDTATHDNRIVSPPTFVSRAQTYQDGVSDKNDFGMFWRQVRSNFYKETGYTESCIDWVEFYLSQAVINSSNLTEEVLIAHYK
ncbi:unnamed protein product [Mucor fragilis]